MIENKLDLTSTVSATVERTRALANLEELVGQFFLEQWRDDKLLAAVPFSNGATNTGKQYVLGASFNATTPVTVWYLGLINGTAGTPTIDPADTPTSHSGWVEFISYNESVRQTWTKGINTPTNQMISTAAAQFTVSNSVAANSFVAGGFLISDNAKSGTAGTLYAHGLLPNAVPVQATDVFKLNYTTGL